MGIDKISTENPSLANPFDPLANTPHGLEREYTDYYRLPHSLCLIPF